MKIVKITGIVILVAIVAGVLIFTLMAHGDDQVSGVALADRQITDIKTLEGINSSKGAKSQGFDGTLYITSCIEFGKYVHTGVATVPEEKALYANVLFNSSPQGMQYKAVWSKDGKTVKEETKAITGSTGKEAIPYMLDDTLIQKGEYTFAVYYADKQLYSQTFNIG